MAPDASAYTALGLEPDADATAIERAYKNLIKQHHPDREGGNSVRAAEINRAYRELRAELGPKDIVLIDETPLDEEANGWVRAAIALLLTLAVLFTLTGPVSGYMRQLFQPPTPAVASAKPVAGAAEADIMSQPLYLAAVTGGVREALVMRGKHDDVALLTTSRDCHRQLRLEPTVSQLDRCAAFDDAIVQLQDRDPMWDQGPFSQIAVTGRQWSAASALSSDYFAIDSRLDRIRLQVELALAPIAADRPLPVPVHQASPAATESPPPGQD